MNSLNTLDWRNKNAQRNYPFVDTADLSLGAIGFLPQDLIIDARIYLNGTYAATSTPYVSRIVVTDIGVTIEVSCSAVVTGTAYIDFSFVPVTNILRPTHPYYSVGYDGGSYNTYLNIYGSNHTLIEIKAGTKSVGSLVVSLGSLTLIQSLGQTDLSIAPGKLSFVPSVCEYLPGPQVTSLNTLTGAVKLRGESGIEVHYLAPDVIRIDIVGDPHFNRYDCTGEALDGLLTPFLERIGVLHYVKNAAGNLVGPYKSILKVRHDAARADGSIDLALVTASNLELEFRPAFRLTVQGNSLTFSLAGA